MSTGPNPTPRTLADPIPLVPCLGSAPHRRRPIPFRCQPARTQPPRTLADPARGSDPACFGAAAFSSLGSGRAPFLLWPPFGAGTSDCLAVGDFRARVFFQVGCLPVVAGSFPLVLPVAGRPGLPSAAEGWVELVPPALRLPASCPGRGAGRELLSAVCTLARLRFGLLFYRGLCCRYGTQGRRTLGCVLLLALRPVLGLGRADHQEARDVREPEWQCCMARRPGL